MKKLFLLVTCCMTLLVTANAQKTSDTFANKDNTIGVGFGIGGVYGFSSYSSQSPVFGVQYDRGIIELPFGAVIGAGGFVGYKSIVHRYDGWGGEYRDRYHIVIIGARGSFHYDVFHVEKLDTYAGAMAAFHAVSHIEDYPDNSLGYTGTNHGNAAYASIFAGAKYYFANNISAYAEVGYGVAWLTMGIAFKF